VILNNDGSIVLLSLLLVELDGFHSFIHSDHFYSTSSSPLILRSAPDTARILCWSLTSKRHMELWVKDLPKVPTWWLERESNPWPSGWKLSTQPMCHHVPCGGTWARLSRLWEQPFVRAIVNVADCLRISQIWRFYYEHNYIKVVQLRPPVMKMVTGSINSVNVNQILSFFYHFAYWKLHNDDKKCLVYRGSGKEGQFVRVYYHLQSRPGIMIVGPTG